MSKIITRAEVVLVPLVAVAPLRDQPAMSWEVRVTASNALLFVTQKPATLDEQLHAYSVGLVAGMDAGRAAMQMEIREALGLV